MHLRSFKHLPRITKTRSWVRSSHRRCSIRKRVLRNFAKFIGKHLSQSLFFNKYAGPRPGSESLAQKFSSEFCEISKNTFFTEHPRETTSVPLRLLLFIRRQPVTKVNLLHLQQIFNPFHVLVSFYTP